MKKINFSICVGACTLGLAFAFTVFARESLKDSKPTVLLAKAESPPFINDSSPPDRSNRTRMVSYADVLSKATPAIVGVYTSQRVNSSRNSSTNRLEEFLRQYYGLPGQEDTAPPGRRVPSGVGSGVIISPNGYILTNNHVISQRGEMVDEIIVKLTDGRDFEAKVVGTDAPTDVALLKIEGDKLPAITMTDSDHLRVGDVVFAIGTPLGVGTTVTMGIVSATGRTNLGLLGGGGYENFIQTDASINLGNSGGALVDASGRLVGINTAIMSRTGGNIGLGFAIPVNLARNVVFSLLNKGMVERGAIGVILSGMTNEEAESFGLERNQGALVQEVVPGKAGAKAGLKNGDIITKVDGRVVDNFSQLRLIISQKPPGTKVSLEVFRDRDTLKIPVVLGSLVNLTASKEPAEWAIPGLELDGISARFREIYKIPEEVTGVVVLGVNLEYDYGKQIGEGTVICEINGQASTSVPKARKLMRPGVNRLYIWRKGTGYRFIAVQK